MPQTFSAKRAVRRIKRQTAVNQRIRLAYKEAVKNVRRKNGDLKAAYSKLDRAAKKGVIHIQKAARLKSRLARLAAKK